MSLVYNDRSTIKNNVSIDHNIKDIGAKHVLVYHDDMQAIDRYNDSTTSIL